MIRVILGILFLTFGSVIFLLADEFMKIREETFGIELNSRIHRVYIRFLGLFTVILSVLMMF